MSHNLTTEQRKELAGGGRTLSERIENPSGTATAEQTDETFSQWIDLFPDQEAFRHRLTQDGATKQDAYYAVSDDGWPAGEPLPDWVDTVESLLESIQTPPAWVSDAVDPDTPFRRVLTAIAGYACRRSELHPLRQRVIKSAVPFLVKRLQLAAARPLYVEFKSYVEHFDPELAAADPDSFDTPPTDHHQRFVNTLLDDGLVSVFLEYPVLARLMTSVIEGWVTWLREIHQRVQQNRESIEQKFEISGRVRSVEPLSTDTHAHGRVPARVFFDNGSIVYKPRSVASQKLLTTVIGEIGPRLNCEFSIPSVLQCDNYGWMEFIEIENFQKNNAKKYYRHAGVLLCLAYVTNATDLQFENILATHGGPVVADAETVYHTDAETQAHLDATIPRKLIRSSVLRTGLLPVSVTEQLNTPDSSIAGLAKSTEPIEIEGQERPTFRAPNTDVVTVESTNPTLDTSHAVPSNTDESFVPSEYVGVIVDSFEECYKTIKSLREQGSLFGTVFNPSLFTDIETRHLFRPSSTYAPIMRQACSAWGLRDGARFSVQIEPLVADFCANSLDIDQYWPFYAAEREAIHRLDVPRFTTTPDGRHPAHDGETLDTAFASTALQQVRDRLTELSQNDCKRQVSLIINALGNERSHQSTSTTLPSNISSDDTDAAHTQAATTLFNRVLSDAIKTQEGDRWVVTTPNTETLQLREIDLSLYDGRAGIGIAAAALWKTTNQTRFRKVARRLMSEIVAEARHRPAELPNGIGRGVASIVYAGTVVADLIRDTDLRQQVTGLVADTPPEPTGDADGVVSGTAGTVLGMVAHYERTGEEVALSMARSCGTQLLNSCQPDGVGFAHGASGVAYALARLAKATGDSTFAAEALSRFRSLRSVHDQIPSDQRWWWCRGVPGIATAFAEATQLLDELSPPEWVNNYVEQTETLSLDHLCCGNAGRAATTLTVARRLGGEETVARRLAASLYDPTEEVPVSLAQHGRAVGDPRFFDGLSGVVYTLVRTLGDEALPSIVSFR